MAKGFIPSTGFSHRASLDEAVRPFLGRVSRIVAVDFLARGRVGRLPRGVDLLMSPGSSRALLKSAKVRETALGLGELGWSEDERPGEEAAQVSKEDDCLRWIGAEEVLKAQVEGASMGWVLDLPCTSETDEEEGGRRVKLTLANAKWGRQQDVGDMDLWGAVVGWNEQSFAECAKSVACLGYATLVISGLWSWMKHPATMCRIVEAVRGEVGESVAIHVTGIGNPEVAKRLSARGVDSMDGASYVRAADRGVQWDADSVLADGSRIEKAHMAIANAAVIGRELEAGWRTYLIGQRRKSVVGAKMQQKASGEI
jgi:hypothetical protein